MAQVRTRTDARGVRCICIDREAKRNALDRATCTELETAFVAAHTDDSVRVVVLRGAGDAAFCAGADLAQLLDHASIEESRAHFDGVARVIHAMQTCRAPVIARVPDYALAGGMGLAVAADFTIAAAGARFGLPEIGLGLLPLMVSAPIYRALGSRKRLLDLVLTGRLFDAEEALTHDLVTKVVAPERLDAEVEALADHLAGLSSTALALGKEAVYTLCEMEETSSLRYLRDASVLTSRSDDAQEGIRAFFEKRKPVWKDR